MANFVEVIRKKEEMCNYCSDCTKCPLFKPKNENNNSCEEYITEHPEESEKIIMAWEKPIDWDIVPVDTKILVRDGSSCVWKKRYFAKYEDGKIFAWENGTTSWSCTYECSYGIRGWKYAKLAERAENDSI